MNREKNLNIPEVPSLFCEFHGISKTTLQETADLAQELCEDCGATGFKYGIEEKDRRELWRAPGTRPGKPFIGHIPKKKP
jgi:D-lactate dehydrogenase (cytochrome)